MQGPSEGDELSQLAPNLRAAARAPSPANTAALREYIQVLGEKPANLPAASTVPHKPRAGSGRRPQRRYFTIKWRPDDADAGQPEPHAAAVPLDPEALKDAILEQARAERQALLEAVWRPGSGRRPCSREFTVAFPPVPPEEDAEVAAAEAAAAEAEAAAAEAAAAEAAALAAQAEALAAEAAEQLLEHAEEQQWEEEEEGVLAEARQQARLRPADAPAGTPGTALQQQDGQPAATADRQQQTSQRGQARTPGTSLFGRYTPMEGVPERLAALAASRGKLLPATLLRSGGPRAAAASTPAGFTPLEGIPERLGALRQLPGGPRLLSLPGATRICSNDAEASVDSPVEGLVQQGAKRSRGSGDAPSPADGEAEFAGFAPQPSPQQEEQQEELQHDDCDDDMGGFADDGGYQGEPSPGGGSAGGFPFLAGGSPLHMADAGVQTLTSLELGAAAAAAAAEEPLPDGGYDGGYDGSYDGGYEGGADFGGMDDYEQPDAELPETSAAAQRRGKKRVPGNAGSRLRNELKRKSLAVDPHIGLHEVVPGVRRSSRQKQEPLKWWLNEKKEFGREHKTMPTVQNVVHKTPNTPWQMVTDIRPRRRPAKKQRAPTPHDLEDVLAAEAEADEEQEEQQHEEEAEEVQEEQHEEVAEEEEPQPPRQQRASRRQQQQQRQQPSSSRRQAPARGKTKAAPAAKGKATKKAAAGKRRGRR